MGKIITVANQKGGVGKTTSAISIASCLAEKGKRVLLVDLDPQGNATSGVGASVQAVSSYELLLDETLFDRAVINTPHKNLSLITSDIKLAAAEIELVDVEKREFRLKTALDKIKNFYDFIFIDCPPSLGLLTINALACADSLLIPIQAEYYALEGVSALLSTYERVRNSVNPELELEGVLITMFDGRTNLALQVAEQVKKHFKTKLFSSVIPRTVRLGEAPSHGLPINVYDSRSQGSEAYRRVADEIIKRNKKRV